jgi:nicotinamide-nucleotide amidase
MQSIEQVINFLEKYNLTLTTAESCTAGLMAAQMADFPGCGTVLESAYVVYSPNAKNRCLGVLYETIETYGLTSEEVAREMAVGALRASGASIVIANTGVADGSAAGVEKGTVCFACAMQIAEHQGVVSETMLFEGERNVIRQEAARFGLLQLPYYYERLRQA